MSVQTSRVAILDVGVPQGMLQPEGQEWEAIDVRFHDFAGLTSTAERGGPVSSSFTCFGRQWQLSVYPNGHGEGSDRFVGVSLKKKNSAAIEVEFSLSTKNLEGTRKVYYAFDRRLVDHRELLAPNFAQRSKILDALIEGALVIEVRMKCFGEERSPVPFVPKNPLCKNILKKFMDEESADVIFEVSGEIEEAENTSSKRAKTVACFHAHHLILQDGAPTLAELCRASGGEATAVPISNVKPEIFHHLLYYVYGGKVLDEAMKRNAKEIIDAADKYGVVNLKLEAEASYVKSTTFATENVLDNLLYADAMNCALLKEAVMDFIVKNKDDIMGKVSFDNVPGSMVTDVLAAMSRGEVEGDEEGRDPSNYNKMRVGTLRKMLHEKGLDVDGSREAMILRLKENNS